LKTEDFPMIPTHHRTRPDHVGGSIWPAGTHGIANLRPGPRGHVVVLAPLLGSLNVGTLRLPAGSHGVFPLPGASNGRPTLYEFSDSCDPPRVFFATE
jgi:hypothetical protein